VLALLPLPVRRRPQPRGLRRPRDLGVAPGRRIRGSRGVAGGLAEAPPLGRRLMLLVLLRLGGALVLLAEDVAEPPRRLAHRRTRQLRLLGAGE
jgi:hypothetical protein